MYEHGCRATSPRLRSTGLCKTSDSSYLLHHRPPALTVQHLFNFSRSVSVWVCVCNLGWLGLKRFSVINAQHDRGDPLPHWDLSLWPAAFSHSHVSALWVWVCTLDKHLQMDWWMDGQDETRKRDGESSALLRIPISSFSRPLCSSWNHISAPVKDTPWWLFTDDTSFSHLYWAPVLGRGFVCPGTPCLTWSEKVRWEGGRGRSEGGIKELFLDLCCCSACISARRRVLFERRADRSCCWKSRCFLQDAHQFGTDFQWLRK